MVIISKPTIFLSRRNNRSQSKAQLTTFIAVVRIYLSLKSTIDHSDSFFKHGNINISIRLWYNHVIQHNSCQGSLVLGCILQHLLNFLQGSGLYLFQTEYDQSAANMVTTALFTAFSLVFTLNTSIHIIYTSSITYQGHGKTNDIQINKLPQPPSGDHSAADDGLRTSRLV